MPFNTIAALETALISWTNAGITSAQAQDLITLGEDRIYREIKTRQMESSTAMAMTAGEITIPSNMIELRDAYLSANPQRALQRKTPDWIRTQYPDSSAYGKPRFIARDNGKFIFGPRPDSDYSVVVNYYARPVTAVGGTLSGILLSSPGLLLYAALSESEPFLGRDERVAVWEAKYQNLRNEILLEDKKEKTSGAALAVTTA